MTDAARFTLAVSPAEIGTAQQRHFGFRRGRISTYADPKVARGMRIVESLARNAMRKANVVLPPFGKPVSLRLEFLYAVPKSRRNRTVRGLPPPREGDPATSAWTADCDNRAKAVQDALTKAGCWEDDRFVTHLDVRKAWTYGQPRIEVEISADEPSHDPADAERLTDGAGDERHQGDGDRANRDE